MKASVLCCLPNQRERLKHAFAESKSAGVPTASPMSATFSASQMTISKRCDVPSCFLFVFAVAGVCVCVCVCVCVREPVVCFCFENGITNVYVGTVLSEEI